MMYFPVKGAGVCFESALHIKPDFAWFVAVSGKIIRSYGSLFAATEQNRLTYNRLGFVIEAEAVAVRADCCGFTHDGLAALANLVV